MARKALLGIKDAEGKILSYDGRTLTEHEVELIERNLASNKTIVLDDDTSISKDTQHRLILQTIIDNIRYYFEFDLINSVTVTSTSELTEHPLVNGDMIADHMYRMPASVSVSGKFALQGKLRYPYNGAGERLANIETIFERIKNEGILCKLMTIKGVGDTNARFKERDNMALTNISWTEKGNTLEFNFTFNEVIMADTQEVEYNVDVTDPNLPAISDASSLDFTDTLLDWNKIDEIIVKQLYNVGILDSDFLQFAIDTAKNAVTASAIGAVIGVGAVVIGLKVLVGIGVAISSIPVAGWITGAVVVAVSAIAAAFISVFKSIKKKNAQKEYQIEQFKLYQNDRQNQQEVERFANYLGKVHQNLEYLEDVLQVYAPTATTNQECLLYVDDAYYIFRFMLNNTTNKYTLTIMDIEEKVYATCNDIEGAALASIAECTHSNCLFRTPGSGFYIYLINSKLQAAIDNNLSEKEINKMKTDLTNYWILVSQIDMEDFNNMLSDIVINAMKK